jgi:negative regulator of sigma E activity
MFRPCGRFKLNQRQKVDNSMKKTNIIWIACLVLIFQLQGGSAWAAAIASSSGEILALADRARGSNAGIEWTLKIHSIENGRSNDRTLLLQARDGNSLATFVAPAKVKGRMVLMRERNMWFIKPGLKKPIPISPRQKLIGGASNGDIATTDYAGDYDIAQVEDGRVGDEDCYLMELVAKNTKVTYAKIRYWISKATHVGIKAEYFTVSGKVFKTATFEYDNQVQIDGKPHPFVSKMTIVDAVASDNVTVMTYGKIRVRSISAATFNLNLLVR